MARPLGVDEQTRNAQFAPQSLHSRQIIFLNPLHNRFLFVSFTSVALPYYVHPHAQLISGLGPNAAVCSFCTNILITLFSEEERHVN